MDAFTLLSYLLLVECLKNTNNPMPLRQSSTSTLRQAQSLAGSATVQASSGFGHERELRSEFRLNGHAREHRKLHFGKLSDHYRAPSTGATAAHGSAEVTERAEVRTGKPNNPTTLRQSSTSTLRQAQSIAGSATVQASSGQANNKQQNFLPNLIFYVLIQLKKLHQFIKSCVLICRSN